MASIRSKCGRSHVPRTSVGSRPLKDFELASGGSNLAYPIVLTAVGSRPLKDVEVPLEGSGVACLPIPWTVVGPCPL